MAAGAHGGSACPVAGWWCVDCAVSWGCPFGLWVFMGSHILVAWRTVFDFLTFLSLRNGIHIVYCGLGCASMVWLTLLTQCCLLRALHVGCWPWHRESVFQRAVFMHVWHLLFSLVLLSGQCDWCGMHVHCSVTCLCCMCRPRIPSALAACAAAAATACFCSVCRRRQPPLISPNSEGSTSLYCAQ